MKTITVNGIVFSDTPPTKEGWWLWAMNAGEPAGLIVIEKATWSDELRAHDTTTGTELPPADHGGFWHELVLRQRMAQEIEKAFREGYRSAFRKPKDVSDEELDEAFEESRAKRVEEGKE